MPGCHQLKVSVLGTEDRKTVPVGVAEIGGPHGTGDHSRRMAELDAKDAQGIISRGYVGDGEHDFGGAHERRAILGQGLGETLRDSTAIEEHESFEG